MPPSVKTQFGRAAIGENWLLYVGLAIVGMVFTASGPLVIILSVAQQAKLPQEVISSWVFATFFLNGIVTIAVSAWTRQPLAFLWTIPGTILVGPTLARYGVGPVVGGYLVCAAVLLILGVSQWLTRLEKWIPMPVIMGMIAGVFLKFGLDLVRAAVSAPLLAGAMLGAFAFFMVMERRQGKTVLPPALAALVAGLAVLFYLSFELPDWQNLPLWAQPQWQTPAWNLACLLEVVVPLVVTVVFVQNAQGLTVLRSVGHRPSLRLTTVFSGLLTSVCAFFGACPSTLAGPTNAILVSAGEQSKQFRGGIIFGLMCLVTGAMAPIFTEVLTALPVAFVAILAGVAMLGVIDRALATAYGGGRLTLSATLSFLISASQIEIASIGSPFWGLVVGSVFSILLKEQVVPKSEGGAQAAA